MAEWMDTVLGASGTDIASPAPGLSEHEIQRTIGAHLPGDHVELLRQSNGFRLYDGYFQLFPVVSSDGWSIATWNDPATWKFAWPDGVDEYLSFGETVWGDQYSYRRDELGAGRDAAVYFVDALRMQARQLAPNFNEFGERFLTRNAIDPFDSVLRQAHEKLGRIQPDTHLVFSPPVLLTGEERLEDVMRMPARQAMILNGDLWTQLANPPRDATVAGLAVVKDEQGRDRMKVAWT